MTDILPGFPSDRSEKKSISGRSLCKNLGRRTVANGVDDDSVIMTGATSLSNTDSSPVRYHTLPRATPSPSGRRGSGTQSEHNASPSHSNRSTPQPSPNLSKRFPASSVPTKPAAIDNSPLVANNSSKVKMLYFHSSQKTF